MKHVTSLFGTEASSEHLLWLDRASIPSQETGPFPLQNVQTGSGAQTAPYYMYKGGSFPRGKAAGARY